MRRCFFGFLFRGRLRLLLQRARLLGFGLHGFFQIVVCRLHYLWVVRLQGGAKLGDGFVELALFAQDLAETVVRPCIKWIDLDRAPIFGDRGVQVAVGSRLCFERVANMDVKQREITRVLCTIERDTVFGKRRVVFILIRQDGGQIPVPVRIIRIDLDRPDETPAWRFQDRARGSRLAQD